MLDGLIMSTSDKVCIAVITGAHGVRGAVRVKPFTADANTVSNYGTLSDEKGKQSFDLTVTGQTKGQLIANIKGVNDRNDAEDLKGMELYINRDKLPNTDDDEFYHIDLIGMRMELSDGTHYGTLKAVHNFGADDLLDVNLAEGGTVMLPFTKEVIPTVDMKARLLVVNPPIEVEARPDEQVGEEQS